MVEEWKIGMVEEWGDSTIRQFENLRMEDCNCPLATGDCRLLSADFPLRFALRTMQIRKLKFQKK
jgi:hypothetical protein